MTAFRLAHLSDIHFGGENREALAAATAWMADQRLDLVVVSGDLTRFGEVAEFRAAAAWLEGLTPPRFVTPGNHDAPYLAWAERIVAPFRRYERHERMLWRRRLWTPLALRFPLFDPDRFLRRLLPLAGPLFSRWGLALWLATVLPALVLVAQNWPELTANLADRVLAEGNLLLLAFGIDARRPVVAEAQS